jgi:hypothetical protein
MSGWAVMGGLGVAYADSQKRAMRRRRAAIDKAPSVKEFNQYVV